MTRVMLPSLLQLQNLMRKQVPWLLPLFLVCTLWFCVPWATMADTSANHQQMTLPDHAAEHEHQEMHCCEGNGHQDHCPFGLRLLQELFISLMAAVPLVPLLLFLLRRLPRLSPRIFYVSYHDGDPPIYLLIERLRN